MTNEKQCNILVKILNKNIKTNIARKFSSDHYRQEEFNKNQIILKALRPNWIIIFKGSSDISGMLLNWKEARIFLSGLRNGINLP